MKIYKTLSEENGKLWDRLTESEYAENSKTASKKEKFDYFIKKGFEKGEYYLPQTKLPPNDVGNFGFFIKRYKRYYDRYLSKDLKIEMKLSERIRKFYDNGKGNEFTSGKFYSVASSSRFAVSSFSYKNEKGEIDLIDKLKINGVQECFSEINLENELKIKGVDGTAPQMDIAIKTKLNNTYFIEAKCHEIFDYHKIIKLKNSYKECKSFNKIIETVNCGFSKKDLEEKIVTYKKNDEIIKDLYISLKASKQKDGKRYLTAADFGCNLATHHFDFKQFLCHLMGIMSYQEKNPSEKIHFYYLFYKIRDEDFNDVYEELKNEINEIKKVFAPIFENNNIEFGYCVNDRFDTLKSLENRVNEEEF